MEKIRASREEWRRVEEVCHEALEPREDSAIRKIKARLSQLTGTISQGFETRIKRT